MSATITESDGFTLVNQPAATYSGFKLLGGQYMISVTSSGAGTAQLQRQINVAGATQTTENVTAALAANTYTVVFLPPGLYNVVVAVAACDVGVAKIKQS